MWLLRGFVPLQGRVATWSENSRWTSFALYESVWYIYTHIFIYIYYTYMIYLCNDTRVSSTNCVYTLNMKYKYTYICADVYPQWNFKTINGEPVAEIPTLRLWHLEPMCFGVATSLGNLRLNALNHRGKDVEMSSAWLLFRPVSQ